MLSRVCAPISVLCCPCIPAGKGSPGPVGCAFQGWPCLPMLGVHPPLTTEGSGFLKPQGFLLSCRKNQTPVAELLLPREGFQSVPVTLTQPPHFPCLGMFTLASLHRVPLKIHRGGCQNHSAAGSTGHKARGIWDLPESAVLGASVSQLTAVAFPTTESM